MLSEMAAPGLERDQDPDPARRTAPDPDHAPGLNQQPDPARRTTPGRGHAGRLDRAGPCRAGPCRTGTRSRTRSICSDGRKSRTRPACIHQARGQARTGGRCRGQLRRRLKTALQAARPGPGQDQEPDPASRAGRGFTRPVSSPDSLDIYAPLPPTSQPDPARTGPADQDQTGQPRRTNKTRLRKIQHIRARTRIKIAPACVGTPWAPLAACGSVSARFF